MAKLRKSENTGLIYLIFDMYNVCTTYVQRMYKLDLEASFC
jgi:hypothetical protein